jgi:hypothetical protein
MPACSASTTSSMPWSRRARAPDADGSAQLSCPHLINLIRDPEGTGLPGRARQGVWNRAGRGPAPAACPASSRSPILKVPLRSLPKGTIDRADDRYRPDRRCLSGHQLRHPVCRRGITRSSGSDVLHLPPSRPDPRAFRVRLDASAPEPRPDSAASLGFLWTPGPRSLVHIPASLGFVGAPVPRRPREDCGVARIRLDCIPARVRSETGNLRYVQARRVCSFEHAREGRHRPRARSEPEPQP